MLHCLARLQSTVVIVPVARCNVCEVAWLGWVKLVVAVCGGVVLVAAIVPLFPVAGYVLWRDYTMSGYSLFQADRGCLRDFVVNDSVGGAIFFAVLTARFARRLLESWQQSH